MQSMASTATGRPHGLLALVIAKQGTRRAAWAVHSMVWVVQRLLISCGLLASCDQVEIMMALEEKFELTLDEEGEWPSLHTVVGTC